MSSDITQRLRAPWGGSPDNCKEAADRIEALKDEVRVATITMKGWINGYEKAVAKVEALEAEVARFIDARKECDRKFQNKVQELLKEFDRANAAEARAERLRVALERIASYGKAAGCNPATFTEIAREALEGSEP